METAMLAVRWLILILILVLIGVAFDNLSAKVELLEIRVKQLESTNNVSKIS